MSVEKISKVDELKNRINTALDPLKLESTDKIFLESFQKVFDGLSINNGNYEKQKPFLKVFHKIMRVHPELEVWLIES